MKEILQKDYSYSQDDYVSVFTGICRDQATLEQYLKKDYSYLDADLIGSEFGIDFGINTYDEDFLTAFITDSLTSSIDELFGTEEAADSLKDKYPDDLPDKYNVCVCVGRMKYTGERTEVDNAEFGKFKFLGAFQSL